MKVKQNKKRVEAEKNSNAISEQMDVYNEINLLKEDQIKGSKTLKKF